MLFQNVFVQSLETYQLRFSSMTISSLMLPISQKIESSLHSPDGMIGSEDIESVGEEDSDEEQDLDAADGKKVEEPKVHECEDHSFLKTMMESFVEKVSMLKTRAGRAGLVHNFLRGLQLMSAPVPSGESPVLIGC